MKSFFIPVIALLLALPVATCAQDNGDASDSAVPEQGQSSQAQTQAASAKYAEGEYYARIEPAQPTGHPDKIEVMEVFSYACPHCYAFEPYINEWAANAPEDVVFVRMPAIFNPLYQAYARAFYTAKALGVVDATHSALFDAIHKQNRRFTSQEDLAAFYSEYGVGADTYLSTAQSFAVETKMERAQVLARRYGVPGVPTIIVNGKYRLLTGGPINSYEELLDVVDYLVQKERQAMGAMNAAAEG